MQHQCSGCQNTCDISQQYCDECLYEIAMEDWIDASEDISSDEIDDFAGSDGYQM